MSWVRELIQLKNNSGIGAVIFLPEQFPGSRLVRSYTDGAGQHWEKAIIGAAYTSAVTKEMCVELQPTSLKNLFCITCYQQEDLYEHGGWWFAKFY